MRQLPRIRKAVKWGGTLVVAMLVTVWIANAWRWAGWQAGNGEAVWVQNGGVRVSRLGPPDPYGIVMTVTSPRGWVMVPLPAGTSPRLRPRWPWRQRNGGFTHTFVPLWVPIAACILPTAVAWRLDVLARRRRGMTLCPKCGYDRAGIGANTPCPECGAAPV